MCRKIGRLILVSVILIAVGACQKPTPTPIGPPTPTPPIRHRDALKLILGEQEMGSGYTLVGQERLEKGKGWNEESTRLSGYRHEFRGRKTTFDAVTVQVECYLSAKDAQGAYRVYKAQLIEQLRNSGQYASINEAEARGLGEWGSVFTMQDAANANIQVIYYLFLRENVLVELSLRAPKSPALADQALKQAQVVDQRIAAR